MKNKRLETVLYLIGTLCILAGVLLMFILTPEVGQLFVWIGLIMGIAICFLSKRSKG